MHREIDYLIVLCPGNPTLYDGDATFSDIDGDMYLGGKDRMRALISMAHRAMKIVLVGGSEDRVRTMRTYVEKELSKIEINPKLICLVSNSGSTENLCAFKKHVGRKELGEVVIVSNEYHLRRIDLVWRSIFPSKRAVLISAEKVLEKEIPSIYTVHIKNREASEFSGCRDWENGRYRNQDKAHDWDEEFWKCVEIK